MPHEQRPISERAISRREFVVTSTATLVAGAIAPRRLEALARHPDQLIYVGTYTEGKRRPGIHVLRMDERTGALARVAAADVGPDPSFVALHPRLPVLYAVNELTELDGQKSGAVAAFALDGRGGIAPLGDRRATGGGAPCYVSVDPTGRVALVANYAAGSVAAFAIRPNGALGAMTALVHDLGHGPNAARQEGPHAHCAIPDPTNRWLLSTDLGTDRLEVHRFDARRGTLVPSPRRYAPQHPGSGPRHLAFHPNGRLLYVIHELDQTVSVYRWLPATGHLAMVRVVQLLDKGPSADATAADIHVAPSGRFVYATVRGPNVVCVLAADEHGALRLVQRTPSGGDWPRNFSLDPSGRFLHVAHQKSNDIVGFKVDQTTGRLTPAGVRIGVPAPVCVRFAS